MRLYTIERIIVADSSGGFATELGIRYHEIAREDKTRYWVRRDGCPRAVQMALKSSEGTAFYTTYRAAMRKLRAHLVAQVRNARATLDECEKNLSAAKAGLAFQREWSPRRVRPMETKPTKSRAGEA